MTATATATERPATSPSDVALKACGLLIAAVLAWVVAPMLGYPWLAWPALVMGIGATIVFALHGMRARHRADVVAQLQLALVSDLGGRTGAARVVARRWTRGWPGTPRRISIRYMPTPAALTPEWAPQLTKTASRVAAGTYRITRNDPGRGRLELRHNPAAGDGPVADTPAVDRARRVVTDLIGPTANVKKIDVDDQGEVREIEVRHNAGAKLVASGYRSRIDRTVSSLLPGRWRAQWDLENDRVRFQLRPSLPDSIWLEEVEPPAENLMENYGDVEIPFGIDEDGTVMAWRPAQLPQAVVVGGTGSGKTSTTHALLVQWSHYGWPIWVADGKAIEFLGFRDWPNVQVVASTPESQVAVIHRAWELMEHRYSLVTRNMARVEDFEPLLLFVDEYADLKGALSSWYDGVKQKGDPRQPPTFNEVASIIRKGRTARVHVVLALQRPDVEFLGGEMRDNLGMRISVGRLSPQGAQMMWEHPGVGVTLPRHKRGRAIAMSDDNLPVEMQCYRTPDPARATTAAELEILDQLRPPTSSNDRLLILDPEVTSDLDSGEISDPRFTDYAEARWVRAEDRPDLDPLTRSASGTALSTGRELSSAMAVLGLTGTRPVAGERPKLQRLEQQITTPSSDGTSPDLAGGASNLEDYSDETPARASDLTVGDLIEHEGEWVVVEDDPLGDVDDPDLLSVPWRGDNDDYGDLVVAADEFLSIRRPKEA